MTYGVDEERGRLLLRVLLGLVFISSAARVTLLYSPLDREGLFYMALTLAPTSVVLCALHRGSRAGWVVFIIEAIGSIGHVSTQLSDGVSLSSPSLLINTVSMFLRLTVALCLFRNIPVGRYLACRRSYRRMWDDVLEIVLYLLTLAVFLFSALWAVNFILHTNT